MKSTLFVLAFLLSIPVPARVTEIDSLLQIIRSHEQIKPGIYNRIARLHYYTDPDKTIMYAEKALALAVETGYTDEKYESCIHIGVGYSLLGNNLKAIDYHLLALDAARELNSRKKLARVYNELGLDYQYSANFEKALEYFLQALRIYENLGETENTSDNKKRIAYVKNNIGVIYDQLGDWDKALEYFMSNYEICKQIGDNDGAVSVLINIGVVYQEKGDQKKALDYYRQTIDLCEKYGYNQYMSAALANLAGLYTEMKKYTPALAYSEKALMAFSEADDKRKVLIMMNNIADLYLQLGEKQKAFSYITDALDLGKKIEAGDSEINTYRILSSYYYDTGEYQKAFDIHKYYDKLKDSLFNIEVTEKVSEMQTKYETERKMREIKILQRDNEIQALKIKQKSTQVYILAAVAALVILLLLVSLLLFNRRRLKQKQMETELEKSKLIESTLQERNAYQSRQLTTHALNMLQKNKLLQEMDNELKAFVPKADENSAKTLIRLRRQIRRNMNSEKDWSLFKLYFEEVNENFFNRLRKKCKSLTTGDLKLAALIKLNLNIKEAAAVLNISPESLRKARYRLRRKLRLYERENLSDYLNSFD